MKSNALEVRTDTHGSSSQGVGKESELYSRRFSRAEEHLRKVTWEVLCDRYFSRFISETDSVLDLAAGDGLFIRNIRCGKKIAVDLSPHVLELEKDGIASYVRPATDFHTALSDPVDVIFMSNFLEHLPNKKVLLNVLDECARALRPDGRLMILQPNIRYIGPAYWDYIDHHIALTEHSLVEALDVCGFEVETLVPRFLPYTSKSSVGRLASGRWARHLIELYLKLPFLWRLFGGQTFVLARIRID